MLLSILVVEERLGDDEVRSLIAIQDIFPHLFLEGALSSLQEGGFDFGLSLLILELLFSLVEELNLAFFVDFDLGVIDTVGFVFDTIA